MEISLCMIVKNEEDVIDKCLLSVKGLVDEIIIVDTGSTDRTISIIESLNLPNVRIEKFEWVNDFSKARNKSLEYATKEWILILDADEILTYSTKQKLEEFLINSGKSLFSIGIYNHVGDYNIIYSNVMLRLFKKHGVHYEGLIHEKLTIKGKANITDFASVPNEICSIEHFGYSSKIVEKKNKGERNLSISLKELELNPDNDLNWYNCAAAYLIYKNYEEALKCFSKVEEISKGITRNYHIDTILKKTDCLLKLDRKREGLEYLLKYSKNKYMTVYPDYYYFLGKLYESLSMHKEALSSFEKALKKDNSQLSFSVEGTNSYITLIEIGRVYMSMQETQKGIEFILKGIFHEDNVGLQGIDDVRKFLRDKGAYDTLNKLESLERKHKRVSATLSGDKNYIMSEATKLIEEGNLAEAKMIVTKVNEEFNDIELNSILAVILIIEGDFDLAYAILEKSMAIDSNDFNTCYNMAYVYSIKGLNEQAIELYHKLMDMADDSMKEEIQELLSKLLSTC